MLMLPSGIKIFIATAPLDMRKSFDGLSALVQTELKQASLSGHLFVFFNKSVDRVKIFYWDRNGYCIWAKRLEKGKFQKPKVTDHVCRINAGELSLLLEGIDLTHSTRLRPI